PGVVAPFLVPPQVAAEPVRVVAGWVPLDAAAPAHAERSGELGVELVPARHPEPVQLEVRAGLLRERGVDPGERLLRGPRGRPLLRAECDGRAAAGQVIRDRGPDDAGPRDHDAAGARLGGRSAAGGEPEARANEAEAAAIHGRILSAAPGRRWAVYGLSPAR